MNRGKQHNVYLGLGSNLGDKAININQAIKKIGENVGNIISISSNYETEPFGFESDHKFLNAACHLVTSLNPEEILVLTKTIEKEMGRKSKSILGVYSDRSIDIDILLYDDWVIKSSDLNIPHLNLHKRDFVLKPLAEIAPEAIHPVLNKTIKELLDDTDNR